MNSSQEIIVTEFSFKRDLIKNTYKQDGNIRKFIEKDVDLFTTYLKQLVETGMDYEPASVALSDASLFPRLDVILF